MNKVIISGRLTRDAEIRYTQGQTPTAIARLTIATDRRFKKEGEPTADFISCTAFGKTAEFFENYGKKGVKFNVAGRIQTGSYTNKDGQTVYTTDVVVEETEFAESKAASGAGSDSAAAAQAASAPEGGFMNIPSGIDEELPFA